MSMKKQKTAIEIEAAFTALPLETLLTKKQIEEITGLSDNTVVTTLAKCGIPTSSRTYSVALLLERFVPARKILDDGGTYEKVEQFVKTLSPLESAEDEEDGGALIDALDQLEEDAAQVLYGAIEERAERLVGYMPKMLMKAVSGAILKGAGRQKFKTELMQILKVENSTGQQKRLANPEEAQKLLPSETQDS
ncbi:MAG: hypothetical protein KME15_16465 [Drouetiella hepatica Uher 2000/2452]|jgi:hypothetical protein|uniref:Uncharacterized protein n=1 Tax=Drouetiella hepatica Uher 2000/2452 TaxID=904376 RepID=A0A951QED9_9CYAN|nr:hypothetical protein [Drouetiella hepatica Uher 2000/2452]